MNALESIDYAIRTLACDQRKLVAAQLGEARAAVAELIEAAGSWVGCCELSEGSVDYFVVRADGTKYSGVQYDRESLAAEERNAWIATALARVCGAA